MVNPVKVFAPVPLSVSIPPPVLVSVPVPVVMVPLIVVSLAPVTVRFWFVPVTALVALRVIKPASDWMVAAPVSVTVPP